MSNKTFVCRCEDVTLQDVIHCVERGYADIEEVKRYTGFGTGPCQGKECLALVAACIAECTGQQPTAIEPFTARPPLTPTALGVLAQDPSAHRFADDLDDTKLAVSAKTPSRGTR
jgi:bacterioferritin-associated ferredoxin